MNIIKYIILGIVQGFTEPLPISSSGHVFILKQFLNLEILNDLNFEIIVNFGSFLAILFIFKDDLIRLIKNFFGYFKDKTKENKNDFRYCLLIIIGTIPVGIAGFLLKDYIEEVLTNINIVGISFIITAIFLFLVRNMNGSKGDNQITLKDSIIIGLVQVIALIPGISRSGSTLIAGLSRDIKKESALKYSFMLYIPISLGTMILGIKDIMDSNISSLIVPYTCGFFASFIVSLFTLKWFMKIVKKGNLMYFSIYCLIVGILVLILL